MSALTDLVTGVAELLAAQADPTQSIAWQPTGSYPDGETGIFVAAVPPLPSRLVTLTPYPLADNPSLADSTVGLQVRTRSAAADPRDVFDLDDAIADVLLGNYPQTLPTGVRVSTLIRSSAVSLGQDDAQRWQWASSYVLEVFRPSLHRL